MTHTIHFVHSPFDVAQSASFESRRAPQSLEGLSAIEPRVMVMVSGVEP